MTTDREYRLARLLETQANIAEAIEILTNGIEKEDGDIALPDDDHNPDPFFRQGNTYRLPLSYALDELRRAMKGMPGSEIGDIL